jgi:hypothetical protein
MPIFVPEPGEHGSVTRRHVLPETVILALLAMADLIYTAFGLATGRAVEGNPLMRAVLAGGGPTALIATKVLLVAAPLAIAEWARTSRPRLVVCALRVAIGAYVVTLLLGTAILNRLL